MNRLTIRRAAPGDAPVIVDFLTRLAEALGYPPPDRVRVLNAVRTILSEGGGRSWYYLAEVGGTVVGQQRVETLSDDLTGRAIWYLGRLYVVPEFRRVGVAVGLLTRVRDDAVKRGVVRLMAGVHAWNQPSHKLIARLGGFRGDSVIYIAELPTLAPRHESATDCRTRSAGASPDGPTPRRPTSLRAPQPLS